MDHKINLDYRAVARGPAPRTGSAGALPMRGLVALGAVFIYPLVAPISPWLAVGLFLLANVLVDFTVAIRQRIPFPDLAIIYHFVVFFCASFVLYFYPPAYYYPNIRPERYHEYLSYAVPACGAVYLGIRIANWRLRTAPYNAALARADPPAWSRYAVPFVVIGCVFTP
ncbi:MAG TPA: hypothetical protein VK689_17820, partial [Armatimonadota bacterium]|nr:hypothetical protein [Armatimonadota bacterium]